MSKHEYYEELGALAAIGQITAEEDKELYGHVSECSSCREAYGDYVRVLHRQLPQAEARRWNLRNVVLRRAGNGELRERFFARARAEGIALSAQAERPHRARWAGLSSLFTLRYAIAGTLLVVVAAASVLLSGVRGPAPSREPGRLVAGLVRANDHLRQELVALSQSIEARSAELAQLQKENLVSAETVKALQGELEAARWQAAQLSAEIQQREQENVVLAGANQQSRELVADLRTQVESLYLTDADNMAALVVQQAQIRELTQALQDQTAKVEQERQLTAVAEDVRKLMGARDLHIIDVHDVDGRGKAARSFGRVFYAEGQSLIFYAFDLPAGKRAPVRYYFQAWGQREAASQSARNLGTFQIDDNEQHRWVLKVSDPALLRDIDSVFVTAEAVGDAKEPRGKKILYAYLGGQPNHP